MRFPFKANSIIKVHVSLGLGYSLEMFYTAVALSTGSETSTWLSPQNKYFFHHVIWTYPGCPLLLSMTTADLCPRYTTFWKWPHHILSPLSSNNLIIIIIQNVHEMSCQRISKHHLITYWSICRPAPQWRSFPATGEFSPAWKDKSWHPTTYKQLLAVVIKWPAGDRGSVLRNNVFFSGLWPVWLVLLYGSDIDEQEKTATGWHLVRVARESQEKKYCISIARLINFVSWNIYCSTS